MAARSSVKSFHLASFPLFFFSYWQRGSDLLVLIRHFPALKLHSPSLPMNICLFIKHPFQLLLTVVKVNHVFLPRFHNSLIQYFTKFKVNFSEDTDSISSWKALQCFLKSDLSSQINPFFLTLLVEGKTTLLNYCVFKLVYRSLVMQYFSCQPNSAGFSCAFRLFLVIWLSCGGWVNISTNGSHTWPSHKICISRALWHQCPC